MTDALDRVRAHLREFDRLSNTAGLIHWAHTDPETDGGKLLSEDVHALVDEVERSRAATVKPDRETLSALLLTFLSPPKHGGSWTYSPDRAADAVLALFPGRTEAEVKEEALSEAADWLLSIGYVGDYTCDIAAPDALWEAFVDAAHQDKDGSLHGNTLTREEVDAWLSEEAGRLAAEGGAS